MTTATDLSGVPWQMRDVPRWGLWRNEVRGARSTKVPFSALTGREASSTKASDWTTFDRAAAVLVRGRKHDGLGFRLGDGWAGVDLDGCRDPESGALATEAADIIEQMGTYAEVSPSHCGIKIFCLGTLPAGRRRTKAPWNLMGGDHAEIEMYDTGRYFTVTGAGVWSEDAIAECTPQLADIHHRLLELTALPPEFARRDETPKAFEDADRKLLRVAGAAKNGAKFKALYAGAIDGHASHSEADLALCSLLAFYAGGDVQRIDALFRGSGLYREKWDEKHGELTYGELTIARSVSEMRNMYSPNAGRGQRVI